MNKTIVEVCSGSVVYVECSACDQRFIGSQARIQRWGDRGSGSPLKNHKIIGFLSNTGRVTIQNHKATKPALNVGPSSARQRNAI